MREELIESMIESAEESTILVSSHDLGEIETFASHIGFMDHGRLVLLKKGAATAVAKIRGRIKRLPIGGDVDDYLRLTRRDE